MFATFPAYSEKLEELQYRHHPVLKELTKPRYFRGYCLVRLIQDGNVKSALEILAVILSSDIELIPNIWYESLTTMDNAVKARSLELLKILHERSIGECTKNAMDIAAANGDLDIVRFLNENRSEGCTYRAFKMIAKKYKHYDVLAFGTVGFFLHRFFGFTKN
ncbi:hypothetical protein THRCLA_20322 [Thraustotheca clavata]|uniref:Uncharacterized protein n=1 Tax=Thraustotheca clavata TaxID=74557 RepID=A0A1W0A8N6_9STRA|nr:hypothetical protein THRCLA_20322 [Thraustotheca clavata]